MQKPMVNKVQYNQNLEKIISTNHALSELILMPELVELLSQSEFGLKVLPELRNGKTHLLNMNLLINNLKR